MFLKISETTRRLFLLARSESSEQTKAPRKQLWADIRAVYRIPQEIKLKVELDDMGSTDYLVIKQKDTSLRLVGEIDDDGFTVFASVEAPTAQPAAADTAQPLTANTAGTARYVKVHVANYAESVRDLATDNDYCDITVGYDDIITRADAGRVLYDAETDCVLIRL